MLPVDSEHSALFQCLEGRRPEQVDTLVLTGSGGPFRGRSREGLADVTPAQALAHPTWRMGPKITVDSATLANKGLELIEAHFLFGIPYDRIEVVIQPTSIVHSLVRFRDGAALAHLGYPDMRVPISYALTYPERAATPLAPLDLTTLTLAFEAPDAETFPMLALAREAGEKGGTFPCTFNAANEVAVAAFLDGRLAVSRHRRRRRRGTRARRRRPGARHRRSRRGRRARALARRRSAGRLMTWSSSSSVCSCSSSCTSSDTSASRSPSGSGRARSNRLPARDRKDPREGIEYGVGVDPARRARADPGHASAGVARSRDVHGARAPRAAVARARRAAAFGAPLDASNYDGARAALPELQQAIDAADLTPTARRSAYRAVREVDEGTGARRLLACADLEARRRHRRRPADEHARRLHPLFHGLRDGARASGRHDVVDAVSTSTPAQTIGLRRGRDRRGRRKADADVRRHRRRIQASDGKPTGSRCCGTGAGSCSARRTRSSSDGRWVSASAPHGRQPHLVLVRRAPATRRATAG